MNIYCPECQNQIDSTTYCPYCDTQLLLIDNHILNKEKYLDIKKIHDTIDSLIPQYQNITLETNENMNNPDFFAVLNININRKNEVLSTLDNVITNVSSVKSTISDYYNNPVQLDYLKSMDMVMGSIESKMLQFLNDTTNILNLLNNYKSMILTNNTLPDEQKVYEVHKNMDDLSVSLNEGLSQITPIFTNQDALNELRYDKEVRNNIRNQILSTLDTILATRDEINNNLENEDYLLYASYYDSKYGNIKDKFIKTAEKIDMAQSELNKMLTYLNSIDDENTTIKQENYQNNGRKLDL